MGTIDWKVEFNVPIKATPAIDPDLQAVYVCDSSGNLTRLHMDDGTIIWVFETQSGEDIRSSPNIGPGGIVLFGSYDSKLYAVYPNGTLAWDYIGCNGWIHTSPAIFDNYVYFGSCDGQLRCLDIESGSLIPKTWLLFFIFHIYTSGYLSNFPYLRLFDFRPATRPSLLPP